MKKNVFVIQKIVVVLFLLIIFPSSVKAEKNSFLNNGPFILMNTHKSEPWIYEENGVIKGIDYEAFQKVAKRLKFDFTVKLLPFKRCFDYLIKGKIDGMLLLYYKKERESFVNYVLDAPMHYSKYYVFVKKGKEFKFNSISDLHGKIIGNIRTFTISEEFDKAVNENKIIIEEVEYREQNITKLLLNRIDAFVSNYASTKLVLNKLKLSNEVVHLPHPIIEKPVYFAFSKNSTNVKDKDKMIKAFTQAINEIKEDGTYDKIFDKYLH